MPVYFDANALVKGYAHERGSECVGQIFEEAEQVFTCKIAFAEVMAAFRKKRDERAVPESQIDQLANQFQHDWEAIATVDLTAELLAVVRQRAFRHSLRALDLLHLSAASWLTEAIHIPVVFVCSDRKLLAAAQQESLPVFDPEHDDPTTLE